MVLTIPSPPISFRIPPCRPDMLTVLDFNCNYTNLYLIDLHNPTLIQAIWGNCFNKPI